MRKCAWVVCWAQLQERVHCHIMDTSFPRRAVSGSGNRVRLSVALGRGLLEAAMALAREEDEFFQAVPQDETMKAWQVEVYFRRNPEMLEFLMRKESLL